MYAVRAAITDAVITADAGAVRAAITDAVRVAVAIYKWSSEAENWHILPQENCCSQM